MGDNSDMSTIEYNFKNMEKARKMLNDWGYSLDDSIFKGIIYHVIPMGVENEENYPIEEILRMPRPVAIVKSEGTLSINRPKDGNLILIEHQNNLKNLVSKLKVH